MKMLWIYLAMITIGIIDVFSYVFDPPLGIHGNFQYMVVGMIVMGLLSITGMAVSRLVRIIRVVDNNAADSDNVTSNDSTED